MDYENRKLTPAEKAGVTAALLMFFGVGMIMGGSSAGNNGVFYSGTIVFAIGSVIALYLLFKYKPKDEDF
jgi:membrane protein implicated in regulation of membrane protease activity